MKQPRKGLVSTPVVEKVEIGAIMSLETFCVVKKYPKSIQARMNVFMDESGDTQEYKLEGEWEDLRSRALNRVTK